MSRFLSAVVLSLVSFLAYAAVQDPDAAANIPPAETVDVIYVILFGVIFVGMIVGFFVLLWRNERKRKLEEK